MAKNQFHNFQYLAVIRTLDAQYCQSPKSSFLRFFAEFKHMIWNSTDGKYSFKISMNDTIFTIIAQISFYFIIVKFLPQASGLPTFSFSVHLMRNEKWNKIKKSGFMAFFYCSRYKNKISKNEPVFFLKNVSA